MVAQKTEQERLEDALGATLKRNLELADEVKRLKTELARREANLAYLGRRVAPLSMLATLVLGNSQLPWEDEAALRAEIARYFSERLSSMPDEAIKFLLEKILEQLSPPAAASAASAETSEASAEDLLASGGKTE